ncbi:MAG: MBL fold metallo-hydrolase [Pseudomonadales bacterium]|nr:MBL fold metallo-hydrolase [Pseudomonadales bacterium]
MLKYHVIPVTPYQQNCSILVCSETSQAVVVDPGGDLHRIMELVNTLGVSLNKILITHAHIDHAGGAATLAEREKLSIEGPHQEDQFWIDKLQEQGSMTGIEGAQPFVPDRWLKDGDSVSFGNISLKVFHCPGHTPGHVVFYQEEAKLAIVGDVLFQGSIGRTDFPLGNHDTLIHSIKQKLLTLGDDVSFISGHGPMSTMGQERRSNPFVSGSYG